MTARWFHFNAKRSSANDLLNTFCSCYPPVDVYSLAQALGVDLTFVSGADWDAATDSTAGGSANIYVAASATPTRQRFAVAHGIGHLIKHEPGRTFREIWDKPTGFDICEIQANLFAADLLMPTWMIWAAIWSKRKTVQELAERFVVSNDAMTHRLRYMKVID